MIKEDNSLIDNVLTGAVTALLVAILSGVLYAIPIKVVWNGVLPHWFDMPTISYWQCMCIVLTVKFIRSAIWKS